MRKELQLNENLCFLEEDDLKRFDQVKNLLARDSGKANLDSAQQIIQENVLAKAKAHLQKSTATTTKKARLKTFGESVFSHYCEVVTEGKEEKIRLKDNVVFDSNAIQAMGLRNDEKIQSQLQIIKDIEFVKSVLSTSQLIKLALCEISRKMDKELREIDASKILHHVHAQEGFVVSFNISIALHAGNVRLHNFSLVDSVFQTHVRDILQIEGCFKPSDAGFTALRSNMEKTLKAEAEGLLTSLHAAKKMALVIPSKPAPLPAEQQLKHISAKTLLAAATAAYTGTSKHRYSTLFSEPRSKFMRELRGYLTEQGQTDITLYALAQAMKTRMEISDKCCGLFVSADDRRGVDRANALNQALNNQTITGLDDEYRSDRVIKAVLMQFGYSNS